MFSKKEMDEFVIDNMLSKKEIDEYVFKQNRKRAKDRFSLKYIDENHKIQTISRHDKREDAEKALAEYAGEYEVCICDEFERCDNTSQMELDIQKFENLYTRVI